MMGVLMMDGRMVEESASLCVFLCLMFVGFIHNINVVHLTRASKNVLQESLHLVGHALEFN